jgi:YD repeat-containing protein
MLGLMFYGYAYNDANQRTRATLADGSYWNYSYDSLGQLRSGAHNWREHVPVAGQQFEYIFDSIGNRTATYSVGDSSGANLIWVPYTPNLMNQYTSRQPGSGKFQPHGIANPSASVTMSGWPAYRRGEYF